MEELAQKAFRAGGWAPTTIERKEPLKGSVARRVADISKIKDLVGWEPQISLEDGLKETFAWYAANPKP